MKEQKKYHGIVVPMVTPVTEDGIVDTLAVEKIVDFFAQHDVAPLIMGTTGEGNSVSTFQGIRMIEAAKKAANGRILIYAGLVGNCVTDQYDAAEQFIKAGADVIAATLPSYYALTDEQMYNYYKELADFLTGAIGYVHRGLTTSKAKLQLIEKLREKSRYSLTKSTLVKEDKVNIFIWKGRTA